MRKEHVFLGATLLTVALSTWMIWPYMDAVLWAFFTAYFLHFFADKIDDYVKSRAITTSIMMLVLIGIVSGVFYGVLTSIPTVVALASQFSDVISTSISIIIDIFDLPAEIASSVQSLVSDLTAQSRSYLLSMFGEAPNLILNLVIYFVVSAFLIRDGKQFKRQFFDTIGSLPEEYRDASVSIVASIDRIFRGVFITYAIVAILVGAMATIGFYLMGLNFYWGWGLIIGIVAFFPIVSAPMVYGPLSLLYIGLGEFWLGVMILLFGVVVLNTLPEVILRPYMASQTTQEHPLLLFTGFIIGPFVLGFKGIILGPILLVVTKDMLAMKYFQSRDSETDKDNDEADSEAADTTENED